MISDNIDGLLKNPDAIVTEFPVVYAAVGETAINDQTTPCTLPDKYEVVRDEKGNPKVVYSDEIKGLGRFVEFTVNRVENGNVSYHVVARNTELADIQNYDTGVKDKNQKRLIASLPAFKKTGIDTDMAQAPGTWIGMGGLISEKTKSFDSGEKRNPKIKKTMRALFVRVLPPSTDK